MNTVMTIWEKNKIDKKIEKMKSLQIEPRQSSHYPFVISAFYNDVYTKGSMIMGVCRGKLAEGLDFSDDAARVVIVVGVPYPLKVDPKTIMKQHYLNEIVRKEGKGIDSSTWYGMQATRATNQAIGRVIRHAEDYGNIILVDERFAKSENINSISKWLRGQLEQYSSFSEAIKQYEEFYDEMKKQNFQAKVDKLSKLELNDIEDDSHFKGIKDKIQEDAGKNEAKRLKFLKLRQKNNFSMKINGEGKEAPSIEKKEPLKQSSALNKKTIKRKMILNH